MLRCLRTFLIAIEFRPEINWVLNTKPNLCLLYLIVGFHMMIPSEFEYEQKWLESEEYLKIEVTIEPIKSKSSHRSYQIVEAEQSHRLDNKKRIKLI